MAEAALSFEAIDPAFAGADIAGSEASFQCPGTARQFAGLV